MPRIVLVTRILAQIDDCFGLSLSVDAHSASMATSGERAIAGVMSGEMAEGDCVTWRARHFGIPFTMTSTISEYDRPHRFVDQQVRGPFKKWWHEHRFVAEGDVTVMTDIAEFEAPFGFVGKLVSAVFLTRYMTKLLEQRNRWLADQLAAPAKDSL